MYVDVPFKDPNNIILQISSHEVDDTKLLNINVHDLDALDNKLALAESMGISADQLRDVSQAASIMKENVDSV